MTIDKALEILHDHLYYPKDHHDLDTQTALCLAHSALKRHKMNKKRDYPMVYSFLPGETEK